MQLFHQAVDTLEHYIWSFGPSVAGESIPFIVIAPSGNRLVSHGPPSVFAVSEIATRFCRNFGQI